nr:reverse transcriptase domain-containing protein [Tanacetum cinerariifolium]
MNRRLSTSYKAYDAGLVVFQSNLKGKVVGEGNITHDFITITNAEHISGLAFNLISVATVGQTQNVYAAEAYQGGNSYQPQDRSISRLVGVAKDVFVKVGTFHFLADFVVADFDADPRVPLILGRSFLKTERALIDVYEGELTLRVGKEAVTFNLDQTSRYLANYNDMTANQIDVIDMACEEYSQEVLGFFDVITSGNPTLYYDPIVSTSSPILTPFGDSEFLLEDVDAFLALEDDPTSPEVDHSYYNTEGDILLLESFLNDDPSLPPPTQGMYLPQIQKELKICEAKNDKYSIDEPPEVELKDLPPHLEYVFLEGDDMFPVITAKDLSVEEKAALIKILKSHKCTMAIFRDMIEKTMEVFMDDFLVFGNSFETCLSYLEKMLQRCEDTNLCLDWEKSHFMVKEGIVIGHKNSKNGIEIARPMTCLLEKDTLFFFSKECVEAFQTLKRKLTEAPILIAPDWELPFKPMCDASDFAIVCEIFDVWGIDFMGPFSSSRGNKYILVAIYYSSKWVEAKALPTNDAQVVCKFLKSLFARFGTPCAIISDHSTHFSNDQFANVMLKYGVTHRLATAYHPQTSGQVEVSNRGLKRILERTVGKNRASWSDKLDNAL